ncbi:ribonuclease H-like domain-containing protein [Tanacetum coccineum]
MFLSQKKYVVEILEQARMVNCNPSRTPVDTDSKLGTDGDPVFDPTLYRSLAGDENPIRTLGDYSRPSMEGYRTTIEAPEGNQCVIPTTLSTAWKIPGKLLSTMRPRIPIEAGYEAKEAGSVKSSATENKDHEMTVEKEEEFKKLKKKPKKKRIITGTL